MSGRIMEEEELKEELPRVEPKASDEEHPEKHSLHSIQNID
jgi:hypothetical protein